MSSGGRRWPIQLCVSAPSPCLAHLPMDPTSFGGQARLPASPSPDLRSLDYVLHKGSTRSFPTPQQWEKRKASESRNPGLCWTGCCSARQEKKPLFQKTGASRGHGWGVLCACPSSALSSCISPGSSRGTTCPAATRVSGLTGRWGWVEGGSQAAKCMRASGQGAALRLRPERT